MFLKILIATTRSAEMQSGTWNKYNALAQFITGEMLTMCREVYSVADDSLFGAFIHTVLEVRHTALTIDELI